MRNLTAEEQITYKQILAKRHASIPLTVKEENFARSLFFDMVTSKKSFQKTFKVITGEELRKSKVDVAAARTGGEHPRQVSGVEDDKPTAQPDTSARGNEKLPDVDNKPKQIRTEEQKLSDMLQVNVDKKQDGTTEPQAKFVAADPVKIGDTVIKSFPNLGLARGMVVALDKSDHAIVRWERGFQSTEFAHALVKAGRLDEATAAAKPGKDKDYPVTKQMSEDEIEEAKELAERLKDKPDVEEPHALARWMVQQGKKYADIETDLAKVVADFKKDGDIVPEAMSASNASLQTAPSQPAPSYQTPFQCLVYTLESTLGLARTVKEYREQTAHDEEVAEYYDGILDNLRGIAEDILAALSMELDEAKDDAEK